MKKIFTRPVMLMFAAMSLFATAASAQSSPKSFVVYTTGGEKVSIPVSESPVLSHNGTSLVVQSATNTLEYNPADIERFTMEDYVNTGVGEVVASMPPLRFDGSKVYISGLAAGARVEVFATSGISALAVDATADGTALIDLSPLPAGALILKFNQSSVKILKK